MPSSKIETVQTEMKTLVREAQNLFLEAASVTGEKADALRAKGMSMLDAVSAKAQDAQTTAIEAGRAVAATTDDFVRENPWQAVAIAASIAAGAGMLIGVLMARR
jgi:ElaB/YqjD/DUF883 family membrane-anchored ribosome-binding protein